ncbi:MAG: choice-of-anchor B family protein [Bacteroidetes bacterium]|nr:choice-of-anchor B family protein [Bacteroidota bacterium]
MKIYLPLIVTSLLFLCFNQTALSQQNITLRGKINYQNLHNTDLNDIWGYTDEQNNEYALVGARKGTSVVNVSDPTQPAEIFWEPGMNSIWRDLKTWTDYAYVTTEAKNGLLIIDLSPLPQSNNLPVAYYNGPANDSWSSAHNLYIDGNGFAYIFGADRGNGGVIILDVQTNPMSPIEVGIFDNWYCHDGYLRNDTLFLAHINDGFISMVDVSDKANPVLLGTKSTPNNFAHNIWASDDGNYAFTTDEKPGAFLTSYDVSDPTNIKELDRIQSSPGTSVIPHNVHVKGNYLITSYYRDGITIHDVSRPKNMVQVGNYDTSPLQGNGFNGCWGVYPFLPSNTIIASDIEGGLFVFTPNYQPACFLEGIATDASNSNLLNGVNVTILNNDNRDVSDGNGEYQVGVSQNGLYDVTYRKVGYAEQTHQLSLQNGVVTTKNVVLVPLAAYGLTIIVKDELTNQLIPDVDVRLEGQWIKHEDKTNAFGEVDLTLFYNESYQVYIGKFGYYTHCEITPIDNQTGQLTILLKQGIYDDFTFDFGWQVQGSVLTGDWVRGVPYGVGTANPDADSDFDCGNMAYVTGNKETMDPDEDDVDEGTTILRSPVFDLTNFTDPYINYRRYFYNFFGPFAPDDQYVVRLSNGITTVVLEDLTSNPAEFDMWIPASIKVNNLITPTNQMTLIIEVNDTPSKPNITDGGFDYFFVSNASTLDIKEIEIERLSVFPNPFNETLKVVSDEIIGEYRITSLDGKLIMLGESSQKTVQINAKDLKSGMYLFTSSKGTNRIIKN